MNDDPNQTSTEVVLPARDYPVLASQTMSRLLKRLEENATLIDPGKLSRIRMPSGRDTNFHIETATGEEHRPTLTGVILAWRQARAYWATAYGAGGGKNPPDCSSKDGFIGIGKPGGKCTDCPLALFGTAQGAGGSGPGQACHDLRQMLLLMPGNMLPHALSVTPTSITAFQKYNVNLMSADADYWGVVTKFSLEPATSKGGAPYSRILFTMLRQLSSEQLAIIEPFHRRMRDLLTPLTVDATAYEVVEEEPEGGGPTDLPF